VHNVPTIRPTIPECHVQRNFVVPFGGVKVTVITSPGGMGPVLTSRSSMVKLWFS